MSKKTKLHFALAAVALVVIGGCGGGGGGGASYFPLATTPAATPTEPAAMQSPYDEFIAYMKALVQTTLDTAEPADVTAFDPPPVSDVLEPIAIQ